MEGGPDTDGPVEYIRTICIKAHHATTDSQIELKVNDIVYVLEQDETGWWGGHLEGQEKTGWFPGSCVRELPDEGYQPLMTNSMYTAAPSQPEGPAGLVHIDDCPTQTDLGAENEKLKKENDELKTSLKQLRRQSDVDRRNLEKLEQAAEQERLLLEQIEQRARQERERRERLERELQAANEERSKLLAEATSLHTELDMERRQAQAQREAAEQLQLARQAAGGAQPAAAVPLPLQEPVTAHAIESQGCVRRLEDQLRSVEEELAKPQDSVKAAAPLPFEARRRPITTPASDGGTGRWPATPMVASMSEQVPTSSARARMAADIPALPGFTGHTGPTSPVPPLPSAASWATTDPSATASSGSGRSRQAASAGANFTVRLPSEEPAHGTVAEKVSLFNLKIQKRSASCNARDTRSARSVDAGNRSPPQLLAQKAANSNSPATPALAPLRQGTAPVRAASSRPTPSLSLLEDDDNSQGGPVEVFLGMSPISRTRPTL